ncbi:MAG: hypothetical protein IPK01_00660 [Acidobacteria bacterium]|nr:hypothetical protein [Acidobacteriota bacterium]
MLEKQTGHISDLIFDSFTSLLRKKSLVSSLKINIDDFSMEIMGANDQRLSPDDLSAGERQLLAVAMLWGLARASNRPLPAVVDTPLGRLDAGHRINLVQNYFPYASHQVFLLSTDEEIDSDLYDVIRPFVSRSYTLKFDDTENATTITDGYFGFALTEAIGTKGLSADAAV